MERGPIPGTAPEDMLRRQMVSQGDKWYTDSPCRVTGEKQGAVPSEIRKLHECFGEGGRVHHFASLTQPERAYQPSGYHNIIHCCTAHG